jgi:hypothetical protein
MFTSVGGGAFGGGADALFRHASPARRRVGKTRRSDKLTGGILRSIRSRPPVDKAVFFDFEQA